MRFVLAAAGVALLTCVPGARAQQPSPPKALPAPVPQGRPVIGVALGGGGALGLSEIGVLRWLEENHIPVDRIAGTSMGGLLSALYSTGHTPEQMRSLTSDKVFSQVFRLDQDFGQLNFRRRQDRRFLPGGFTAGLRHGVAFRNGVLLDSGLNAFLNQQFTPYNAGFSFDRMPIPFRCVATDIRVGREAIFEQGPLAEAVRASISIPGVFPPLQDGDHVYVDGAIVENLPVQVVRQQLQAQVVIAVSLPLTPPAAGETDSILGILGRSFSVASWSNEVRSRQLADVLIEPITPTGLGVADYASVDKLAASGYAAAEKQRTALLRYQLNDADWAAYLEARQARQAAAVGNVARIVVQAATPAIARGVRNTVADLAGKPLDPATLNARLTQIDSDGRLDAVYYLSPAALPEAPAVNRLQRGPAQTKPARQEAVEVLHPTEQRGAGDNGSQQTGPDTVAPQAEPGSIPAKPQQMGADPGAPANALSAVERAVPAGYRAGPNDATLHLLVRDRSGGPPFLTLGGSILAQTGGTARATLDGILLWQDLGGYRSEFRSNLRFGSVTEVTPEYLRRLTRGGLFVAPRFQLYREEQDIWANQFKVAQRQTQQTGFGVDLGYTFSHQQELRAGWQINRQSWLLTSGSDGLHNVSGTAQLATVRWRIDQQDRALIPTRGLRADASVGYLYNAAGSEPAPRLQLTASRFAEVPHQVVLGLGVEGGSYLRRNVGEPYRFLLGGPLRLSASNYQEYRGTDYWLLRPTLLRRVFSLPQPLGQSVYVLSAFEAAQIWTERSGVTTRVDGFIGLAAETPLGAITVGPAIGSEDHRKFVFTLGRVF